MRARMSSSASALPFGGRQRSDGWLNAVFVFTTHRTALADGAGAAAERAAGGRNGGCAGDLDHACVIPACASRGSFWTLVRPATRAEPRPPATGNTYELGALLSIKDSDTASFERHVATLKTIYADHACVAAALRALARASPWLATHATGRAVPRHRGRSLSAGHPCFQGAA